MTLHLNQLQPKLFTPRGPSEIWGADLTWGPQDRILVTGISGQGKTSLVHFLAGFSQDYSGEIHWDGAPVPQDASGYYTGPLAIVFQTLRVFPELTGWENIRLREEAGVQVPWDSLKTWAEDLGIAPRMEAPLALWSQGERQRLALLRALAQPFSFVILDEPFSHLDQKTTDICWKWLQARVRERSAGLLITALDSWDQEPFFNRRFAL